MVELCGCVLDSDGRVLAFCDGCRPSTTPAGSRTPQEARAAICEHVSRICNIAVADARIERGRWQVKCADGEWRDYQELIDAATRAA
jgi:hypothetical protein